MNVHVQAEPERVIATSEGIELQGRGKVKLTITERRIIVEKKASLFSNKLAPVIILDYSQISGITQEGSSSIKVSYTENSKPASITFVAKSTSSALSIMNQVVEILQTGKRKFEEEAEKKRKEEMDDTLFVIYLFESMINIWAMVSPVREMLSAMGQGEWSKVEVHAKSILTVAEELIRDAETNLGQAMADFSEAIKSRSPLAVNEKVSALFAELGTAVSSKMPISKKWAQYTREMYPNWSSLSYFLLFALGLNEMLVGSELGKQKEVDEVISRIRRILPVIEIKIGKYLVDSFNDAIRAKDPFSVPQKISNLLLDELQKYLTKAASV
ncbi:MAG: hypothetical protein HYY67_08090 [Thaumarchaeota archaeon]|nr:hypothetical protein [Nitrososphaerota archaeon]